MVLNTKSWKLTISTTPWNSFDFKDVKINNFNKYLYISICLFLYISTSLYLYISISLYLCISIYNSISLYLYIYLYVSISLHITISLYIYIYLYISISLYIPLYLYTSLYLHISQNDLKVSLVDRRHESDFFLIDLRKGSLIFRPCFFNAIPAQSSTREIYWDFINVWSGATELILELILNWNMI